MHLWGQTKFRGSPTTVGRESGRPNEEASKSGSLDKGERSTLGHAEEGTGKKAKVSKGKETPKPPQSQKKDPSLLQPSLN